MYADEISVIIPCYFITQELVDMTKRCVDSLLETAGAQIAEVVVIDDGSPLEGLQQLNLEVLPISMSSNGGYASAVNAGLTIATGDVLTICNNDIEFIQTDWLEHLLKPLKEGYDIASIRTTDADGWLTEDKITDGDKFGSIWAMKRKVYEVIGELDESFGKGYFEDLDYHKRAENAGFKVAKNHAGIVEHYGKQTFGTVDPDDVSYKTARARFRAKWGAVW